MRLLYLDIDSLRPDHLGCYGYERPTSPCIDSVAAGGIRFDNTYVSDAPCLPSRTALFSGRFGIHTGVVNHGGTQAEMFNEGPGRGFSSRLGRTSWMRCLRNAGMRTVSVSPFAERHSAWHFCANFSELYNPGRRGLESADEIAPIAIDWLERNGAQHDWFLHLNLWDPHAPYRAPVDFISRFASEPVPDWLTEEVRRRHWSGCGPHSAQEAVGYGPPGADYRQRYPQQPTQIDSPDAVRRMFDGYDAGVRYADHWVGEVLATLDRLGISDETAILISADHGENLGELNVYGDHQTADQHTCRVPLILRWPGVTDAHAGDARSGLHYQVDVAATIIELIGGEVPDCWDGASFAGDLRSGIDSGRDALVLSQAAWSCQRSVRFRDAGRELLYIDTLHDAHHLYPNQMLFDLADDPHEQVDLASELPQMVDRGTQLLSHWKRDMMNSATHPVDPMDVVLTEGGPKHTRGELPAYLERLRQTDRSELADELKRRHSPGAEGDQ